MLTGLAVGAMVVEPDQVALLACYVLAAHVLGHWLLSRDRTRALKASLKPLALRCAGQRRHRRLPSARDLPVPRGLQSAGDGASARQRAALCIRPRC